MLFHAVMKSETQRISGKDIPNFVGSQLQKHRGKGIILVPVKWVPPKTYIAVHTYIIVYGYKSTLFTNNFSNMYAHFHGTHINEKKKI